MQAKSLQLCLPLCNPTELEPAKLPCPWDSPGNTGVGCHALLRVIFPTQGSNHVSSVSCIGRPLLSLPLVPPGKPIEPLPDANFTKCFTYICFLQKLAGILVVLLNSSPVNSGPSLKSMCSKIFGGCLKLDILGILCFSYVYIAMIVVYQSGTVRAYLNGQGHYFCTLGPLLNKIRVT